MDDVTPCGSQENISPDTCTPISNHDGKQVSSSQALPASGSQHGSKPRKPPTVTPRSFTRFFTPKASLKRSGRVSASRQALRDITASASNRGKGRIASKEAVEPLDDSTSETIDMSKRRKRKAPGYVDIASDVSSPLKRIRNQSLEVSDNSGDECDGRSESEENDGLLRSDPWTRRDVDRTTTLITSNYRNSLGRDLRRETNSINSYCKITKARSNHDTGGTKDWQYETTNFFSSPEDVHMSNNLGVPSENTIAFCTASCHTNSLVAIGDEDGSVRLLESSKDEKPDFAKAYLSFHVHDNAILDLAFSSDDLLLATASGDQTSRVVDMPTQRATHAFSEHTSSVKQVCFQPGNSNVIATSSRDGSVQIWDLRCKGLDAPVRAIKIPLEPPANDGSNHSMRKKLIWGRPVNTILEAHHQNQAVQFPPSRTKSSPTIDPPSKTESPGRRGDASVTALQFLSTGREHLLLTASEADAGVKLWDLRKTYNHRRRPAAPVSSTRPTGAHTKHRHFGVTSFSLSGDGARLYSLCRDNTLYAYSTSHLILGHGPELSKTQSKSRRFGGQEKEGLGPMYGFRHPSFHAATFYVKSALRPASNDKTEVIAVGSSDGCAVVFPTNEKYMQYSHDNRIRPSDPFGSYRPSLKRSKSGTNLNVRLLDSIPIYEHGSALVQGHSSEVTALSWTHNGELVTLSDDYTIRCWREGDQARELRTSGEKEGRRWKCGWAEADSDWDDEDG
ncbi:hypothetical protein ACLMJK_009740 [Lecanora helva]